MLGLALECPALGGSRAPPGPRRAARHAARHARANLPVRDLGEISMGLGRMVLPRGSMGLP